MIFFVLFGGQEGFFYLIFLSRCELAQVPRIQTCITKCATEFPITSDFTDIIINPKWWWVSMKYFVEEDDMLVDLLTKFQPDPVWHLRETIKTLVRYRMCCKFFVLHICWIFSLLGGCHLSRRVRMTSHGLFRCQGKLSPKF
jgi:hypothetical protein